MTVWKYPDLSRNPARFWREGRRNCAFCEDSPLRDLRGEPEAWMKGYLDGVYVCSYCGWWTAEREQWTVESHQQIRVIYGAVASLKELDLTDQSTPLDEIRAYLAARYDARSTVDPCLFERTVASVFDGLGYSTCVTGYSNDGGIDVLMEKGGDLLGVQVKRYKGRIKVEQIRSLAGAMLLAGLTRGVFVTTSDFQSGARKTVATLAEKGYAIELVNAEEFYGALRLAQINLEEVTANLDRDRIMSNLAEVSRSYESNPHGP